MFKSKDAIGKEIQRLRISRGLTGAELARSLKCTQSFVSKIESGKALPALDFVEKVIKALKVEALIGDRLLAMTNDFLITFSRWTVEQGNQLHKYQDAVRKYEEGTSSIHSYCLTVISGLLQTPKYASTVFRKYLELSSSKVDEAEITKAVRARLRRQNILTDVRKQIILVHSELSLSNPFPTPEIHKDQLIHLEQVLLSGRVDVRILPADALISPPPLSAFTIYDGLQVQVEGPVTLQRLWDERDVGVYQALFKNLLLASVSGRAAIDIVRRNLKR